MVFAPPATVRTTRYNFAGRTPAPVRYQPPTVPRLQSPAAIDGRAMIVSTAPRKQPKQLAPIYSPGSDIDGDGNYVNRTLTPPLSATLRPAGASRWLLPSVAAVTPQYVEAVLRGGLAGNHVQAWELFDLEIDTDPEIASCVMEYMQGVTAKKLLVTPYAADGEEPTPAAVEKAAMVRNALLGMRPDMASDEDGFTSMVKDIIFARFHGQSVLEIDWYKKDGSGANIRKVPGVTSNGGNCVMPRAVMWVHPVCYAWDNNGRLGLRIELANQHQQQQARRKFTESIFKGNEVRSLITPAIWDSATTLARASSLVPFPENNFLVCIDKFKAGTVMGSGSCLRALAFLWIASNLCADWALNYAQLFGIPLRKAFYTPGTPQGKILELKQMMATMGSMGYVTLQTGNDVVSEAAAGGAGESPQAFLLHYANDQKRKVILQQTMSGGTAGGGSKGVGKSFGDTEAEGAKDQCFQSGADFACTVLNTQFVPYLLTVNGMDGDQEAPIVSLVDESVGTYQDAQTVTLMAPYVDIGEDYVRSLFKFPKPKAGEKILGVDTGSKSVQVTMQQQAQQAGLQQQQEPDDDQDFSGGGQDDGTTGDPAEAKNAISARVTPVPPAAATVAVTRALKNTAAPLVERMRAIDAISDPEMRKSALLKLLADLPAVTKALKLDPSLAEATAKAAFQKPKSTGGTL